MTTPKKLRCDTCGALVDNLRRDVVDDDYNALNKPALWNCDRCYEEKRARRQQDRGDA
jgi:uncharacterized protein with PIN domain